MVNTSSKSDIAILNFYNSTIGKKVVMAVTGLILLGFVVMHLLGNLQIFLGPEKFNEYAAFLQSISELLWIARTVLLVSLVLHVITAFLLKKTNRDARKVGYLKNERIQVDPATLYMLETGVVILFFVILHLAHFTFGVLQPESSHLVDSEGRHDVYQMVILGFNQGPYSIIYIISMIALSFHLRHAFWSMFQSVGAYSPNLGIQLKKISKILAIVVAFGYISIPLSVQLGLLN